MSGADAPSAAALAALARALTETAGFQPKLELILSSAGALTPCRWASIAVTARLSDHPARLSSSTDPQLGACIAEIASRSGSSPGIDAFERGEPVHCPDLATENQFPEYAACMLARTRVRSVLSFPIVIHAATAACSPCMPTTRRASATTPTAVTAFFVRAGGVGRVAEEGESRGAGSATGAGSGHGRVAAALPARLPAARALRAFARSCLGRG
jgi:hypothetical protein